MTSGAGRARLGVALALAGVVAWGAWGQWSRCQEAFPADAADAVPLYLQGIALREGGDPTDAALLAEIKTRPENRELRSDIASTLYPPSMAAPMALLVGSGWEDFLARWRALVIAAFALGSAAAGWGAAPGRWAPLGAAVGAGVAVSMFPLTEHALALGQANLLIVGILGFATWAAARDRPGAAAGAAALGVAVKLVPGVALWPLLAARRWRALGVAVGIGVLVAGITLANIPAGRIMANLLETIRFQQGVTPAWLTLFPGPVLPFLGVFRFSPLGCITLAITGVCAHATRDRDASPAVLASAIALLAAWLGAAASAVGVFYGLLGLPAIIRVSLWPASERAPRWAWALVALAIVPRLVVTADDAVLNASFQMFLVGLVVWAASAGQLLHAAWRYLGGRERAAMGIVTALALGFSITMVAISPAFPEDAAGNGGVPVTTPDREQHAVGPADAGGRPGEGPPIADTPRSPTTEPVPVPHLVPAASPDHPTGPPEGPPDHGGIPGTQPSGPVSQPAPAIDPNSPTGGPQGPPDQGGTPGAPPPKGQ